MTTKPITIEQANKAAQKGDCKTILREFVQDIETVGIATVGSEWPDLLITYRHAKEALKNSR